MTAPVAFNPANSYSLASVELQTVKRDRPGNPISIRFHPHNVIAGSIASSKKDDDA